MALPLRLTGGNMKALVSLLLILGTTMPAMADKKEDNNKKLVQDFYNLALNEHKPAEAMKKYVGDKYIQHNPNVPNGPEPFINYFEGYFKQNPHSKNEIKKALADGDLVALHVLAKKDDKDPGSAIVDIFRVDKGKIVEHWDVIQPVPAKSANNNTMF
jgi:predicted SnoaL-like aldol condensation-catalyzing enzyme